VRDEDEAVIALQLDGDRLDQRIVLVGVLDPAPDRLDQLEEVVRIHLVVAAEEDVGEDVLVAFVELVEEHAASAGKGRAGRSVSHPTRDAERGPTPRDSSVTHLPDRADDRADEGGGPTTPTVVVVGSAARDLVDDDPRGWRLGGGVSYSALT